MVKGSRLRVVGRADATAKGSNRMRKCVNAGMQYNNINVCGVPSAWPTMRVPKAASRRP